MWRHEDGMTSRIYVDIKIADTGLTIKNIEIIGHNLPEDGIFQSIKLPEYQICFPRGRRYDVVTLDRSACDAFKANFFDAVNRAPLVHGRIFKAMPPANWRKRMQRARAKGKVPVLVTGLTAEEAARYIRLAKVSKPTYRWFERDGRQHCLKFYFPDQIWADKTQDMWDHNGHDSEWQAEFEAEMKEAMTGGAA
jgi:hypothetical protein